MSVVLLDFVLGAVSHLSPTPSYRRSPFSVLPANSSRSEWNSLRVGPSSLLHLPTLKPRFPSLATQIPKWSTLARLSGFTTSSLVSRTALPGCSGLTRSKNKSRPTGKLLHRQTTCLLLLLQLLRLPTDTAEPSLLPKLLLVPGARTRLPRQRASVLATMSSKTS